MPLASALPIYEKALTDAFKDLKTNPDKVSDIISKETKNFAIQGVPMVLHAGSLAPGQAIAAFVTTSPGVVTATGTGGIDSSSPGAGLASVKSTLQSSLEKIFKNTKTSPEKCGKEIAKAVMDFYSKAKIMTNVTATAAPGVPVLGPAGPVPPSPYTGSGTGGIDSPTGAGFSSVITAFKSVLSTVFKNTKTTPEKSAKGIADGMFDFLSKGMVATTDSGTAGGGVAVVTVPPAPTPGVGSTTSPSPIISGSSVSGTIS